MAKGTDQQKIYDSTSDAVGFLVGGIGTGTFTVGARGQLKDWEIFNSAGKGNYLSNTFFAIHLTDNINSQSFTRVLEAQLTPPFAQSHGFKDYEFGGLPRFNHAQLQGEYPVVTVDFIDEQLPVEVRMVSFNPLIPLNSDDSGIPAGVIRYVVKNRSSIPLQVSIAGSLANFSSLKNYDRHTWGHVQIADAPRNLFRTEGAVKGLYFTPEKLQPHDFYYGTMALMTTAEQVSYKRAWLNGGWWDGLQDFWDDFQRDGRLEAESFYTQQDVDQPPPGQIGSLAIHQTIQPSAEASFEFVIAWSFPHRVNCWSTRMYDDVVREKCESFNNCPLEGQPYPMIDNYYAKRFPDAWVAGSYLLQHLTRLEGLTNQFRQALYQSTLPRYVLDAVSANITVLRSNTCFRIADGTLLAFEGCFDDGGCCEGNCTHVWNYAQTVAFLFPDLEQSMRKLEYLVETTAEGKMNFRSYSLWGMGHDQPAAADGQFGTIVRLYREWKFSGDDEFLRTCWPAARRTLEYGMKHWDQDGDGVTETDQHNTYDISFHGANSLVNSLFYAALQAAVHMANAVEDHEKAREYEILLKRGQQKMDELLWNGEYYVQRIDDPDRYRYQYGNGCLADQLFGQTLAHLTGLGYILPQDHVRQAIYAVYQHNFKKSLQNHHHTQRTYALQEESGLLLCTWPHGGRPRLPFPYSDEVWTGIEYHVATHLIYEGFVEEGLTVVKAVRDRHDGIRRNPWNEVECGHHYARSMASYGVYLALTGFRFDLTRNEIGFHPAVESDHFSCFFSTGSAWGIYTRQKDANGKLLEHIEVLYGNPQSVRLVSADHLMKGGDKQ